MYDVSSQPVWRLSVVFVAALLLFVAVRFDAESFARSRIAGFTAASGIDLSFGELDIFGLNVDLHDVSVHSAKLPEPLMFEHISLSPALGRLFTGELAFNVDGNWQGIDAGATLSRDSRTLMIDHLQVAASAADLLRNVMPFLRLPVQVELGGGLELAGEVEFNQGTGTPESVDLTLVWEGAEGSAMGVKVALGKLLLQMQGDNSVWQWKLVNPDKGIIEGEGAIRVAGRLLSQWALSGDVVIHPAAIDDPGLRSWLPKQGGDSLEFKLSGSALRPGLTMVR